MAVIIAAFAALHLPSLFSLQLLLLLVVWRKYQSFLSIFILLFLAISSYYYIDLTKIIFQESGKETLSIQYIDAIKIDGRQLKGFAKTSEGDIFYARYTIQTQEEKQQLEHIRLTEYTWTVDATIDEIPPAAHDYAFHMSKYLQMNGAKGILNVDRISSMHQQVNWIVKIKSYRQGVIHHIEQVFPESLVAEAKALLVGDRSDMTEETSEQYRTLGITHLFAISGLHVGLLTFFVRECLLRMRVRHEHVNMLLFSALPLYALLVGGAPSVWRASVVTMFILCVKAFHWRIGVDQLLATTCIIFVLLKPYLIFQPGFQLSYGAAFALITSSQILTQTTSYLKQSFWITAISQIALYPVLLWHFYEVSISSFLVNLLYVPLYSVVILPMNILLLLSTVVFSPLAGILFYVYEPLRGWIEVLTLWIANLPYQLWSPGKPSAVLIVLAIIGVVGFFVSWERRHSIWLSLTYLLFPVVIIQVKPYVNADLQVHFVDVGQGDSIVIELPYRKGVYVIDAGGALQFGEEGDWRKPSRTFEVGRQIVLPFLKGKGISTIDHLILSHPDMDHVGGMHEVMEDIRVQSVHTSPNTLSEPSMKKLITVAREKDIAIDVKRNGDGWETKDARFVYMGPQDDQYVGNDSSLVLYMQSRGYAFLFTGDIEEQGERKFVSSFREVVFPPTILKVAHHGSKTSSSESFLEVVKPILAVAMQGRNNRFNHPSDEVVERYEAYGIPLLTTQEFQTITIIVNRHGKLFVQ